MARSTVSVKVRIADLDRTRLLLWELQMLLDDMRVGASPFAHRLEAALDRYVDGILDEHGEDDE